VVCCLNPQKLGAITLAFQVYVVLHCFLPLFEEILIENSILNTAKTEANNNRPPEKSPHAPPARSRVGKTFSNQTLVLYIKKFKGISRRPTFNFHKAPISFL
jgi:hypothetical protein